MVTDENDKAFFVQKDGQTFQFKKSIVEENEGQENKIEIGSIVKGFVYKNSQKRLVFTDQIPTVGLGRYDWATVTQVRKDLGVFVDIGLPDKDMVVSLDQLPNEHKLWPKKGNRLYVELTQDKKDRVWASLAEEEIVKSLSKPADASLTNKDIEATVYRLKMAGTLALSLEGYLCFLHPSERASEPTLGQVIQARVIGVRPDGLLNISMRPRAFEAIPDDAQMILTMLQKHPDHSLPYWDKSSPEEIQNQFGISKGQFKRAIGNLLKERKIIQNQGSISLIQNDETL